MLSTPSANPLGAGFGAGPSAMFRTIWHHRRLIARLAKRELTARYRGSLLGMLWAVINPLLMLGVYTFVFTTVFQARWGTGDSGSPQFALLLFSGLILFTILSDCVSRAPGLLLENASYIKKVVFPLEILPVTVLAVALVNAAIGLVILLLFHLLFLGLPPATVLLLPLVIAPLSLTALGLSWFLASAGVFLRDIRQVVGVCITMLMFLSPIFYPVSAVPERFRVFIHLNPLTPILEQSKDLLFWGRIPSPVDWGLSMLAAWVIAWLGYVWFTKTRRGFADVV